MVGFRPKTDGIKIFQRKRRVLAENYIKTTRVVEVSEERGLTDTKKAQKQCWTRDWLDSVCYKERSYFEKKELSKRWRHIANKSVNDWGGG